MGRELQVNTDDAIVRLAGRGEKANHVRLHEQSSEWRGGSNGDVGTWRRTARLSGASNGAWPHKNSYVRTPKHQMSACIRQAKGYSHNQRNVHNMT